MPVKSPHRDAVSSTGVLQMVPIDLTRRRNDLTLDGDQVRSVGIKVNLSLHQPEVSDELRVASPRLMALSFGAFRLRDQAFGNLDVHTSRPAPSQRSGRWRRQHEISQHNPSASNP